MITEEQKQAFKEELCARIKASGSTQTEVARALGFRTKQNLGNKLSRGTLRATEERQIADFLGYTVIWQKNT